MIKIIKKSPFFNNICQLRSLRYSSFHVGWFFFCFAKKQQNTDEFLFYSSLRPQCWEMGKIASFGVIYKHSVIRQSGSAATPLSNTAQWYLFTSSFFSWIFVWTRRRQNSSILHSKIGNLVDKLNKFIILALLLYFQGLWVERVREKEESRSPA